MIDILETCAQVLGEAGFTTTRQHESDRPVLAFEDVTVVGFVITYENPAELISNWSNDIDRVVERNRFSLRVAAEKAWNTYVALLAAGNCDYAQSIVLSAIEEDLTGTRKVARAGLSAVSDVHAALLPLLPLQFAPHLEAVDTQAEIRLRTTELPTRAVEAFLSAADESVLIRVLEEES